MALSVAMPVEPPPRRTTRSIFGPGGHVWIPEIREFYAGYDDLFEVGVRSTDTQTNAQDYVNGLFLTRMGDRGSNERRPLIWSPRTWLVWAVVSVLFFVTAAFGHISSPVFGGSGLWYTSMMAGSER